MPLSPYIKGPQGEEEEDTQQMSQALSSPPAPPPLSLWHLYPVWLPKGPRRGKDYTTAAHRRAAGIMDMF
jgi:hypothetical protein